MWQKRQSILLRDEIEALLVPLSPTPSFYDLVKRPLTETRRGLADSNTLDHPWPLLPLMACEAICGHYEQALPAAAALQLLIAAAEVFDDIEDADSSHSLPARYGIGLATNAATTLLILAERAIARLKERGVEDYAIVRIIDVVNSFYTKACTGQHLDLTLLSNTTISEDAYLRIVSMKSASHIECACYIGALLSETNQKLLDTFAMFGHNLGMASQITNDIQGITQGIDIVKHRITLPVIYALTQADNKTRNQLEAIISRQSESIPDAGQIRDLLFHTGSIHYATIKMELYKQQALEALYEAKEIGADVERLKLFLE